MDALAREIFDKAGFATRELRNLYADTQSELADALLKLKEDFDQEVLDANTTLLDSIREIRADFTENIKSMKGELGGLSKAIEDFYKKLGKAEEVAEARIVTPTPAPGATPGTALGGLAGMNVAASQVTDATGILIDSAADVARVLDYLALRIEAANKFANEAAIAGRTTEAMAAVEARNLFRSQQEMLRGGAGVGTIININVKTDSTQSLAMVGKSLGNTITKYVTAGGQVVVSPTN